MLSGSSQSNAPAAGVLEADGLDREEMLRRCLPTVRRMAYRMVRRLPPNVDVDDLIGAGHEGLLKALDSYDPERHDRFESYAELRIRGAILDELRAYDPMTRHGRRRLGQVSRTITELRQKLGREPEADEVAEALGLSLEEYHRLAESLARGPALGRLGETEGDDLADAGQIDPLAACEQRELRQRLAQAIRKLPERTQLVLALYYQDECTQAEIGKVLGVTESRVCQILGEAAARLRSHLGIDEPRKPRRKRRARRRKRPQAAGAPTTEPPAAE